MSKPQLSRSLAFLALLSSCVTATRQSGEVETSRLKVPSAGKGILLVTFDVKGAASSEMKDCDLLLAEEGKNVEWRLRLDPAKKVLSAELPPGRYVPSVLQCSAKRGWQFSSWQGPLPVVEGKIGYGGHVTFHLERWDSLRGGLVVSAPEGRQLLSEILSRATEAARSSFVSAWTGKPIAQKMLGEKSYSGLMYRWKASKEVDSSSLVEAGRQCETQELNRNRVFLGRVSLEARYLKGKLDRLEDKSEPNTYSNDFLNCLKGSLQAFAPRSPEPMSVTLDL